jgi:hypothetical protein
LFQNSRADCSNQFILYRLQHLGPNDSPEALSGQFQGDIILTQEQVDYFNELRLNPNSVLVNPTLHWPDATIPYEITGTFCENFGGQFRLYQEIEQNVFFPAARDLELIEHTMFNMMHHTCLRFVKRTTEVDYVSVEVSLFPTCHVKFHQKCFIPTSRNQSMLVLLALDVSVDDNA